MQYRGKKAPPLWGRELACHAVLAPSPGPLAGRHCTVKAALFLAALALQ